MEDDMDMYDDGMPENLFWGLNILGGNKYAQTVTQPFQISSAALAPEAKAGNHYVYMTVDDNDFLLCTLNKDKWPQHTINVQVGLGESVKFHVKPKENGGPVTLSGHFIGEAMDDMSDMDDDDIEDEDDEMMIMGPDGDDSEEEDEVATTTKDGKPKVREVASDEDLSDDDQLQKKRPAQQQPAQQQAAKKAKQEPPAKAGVDANKPPQDKAKQQKTPPAPEKKSEPKKEKKQEPKQQPQPKPKQAKLAGGTVAEDVVVGTGPKAKKGMSVAVEYVGRLASNNKIFDQCVGKKPFRFKLGYGEVIKGWDVGVEGMQVGGKRILRIPPAMAYGARGAPPSIPPNSTLVFEVSLVNTK